MLERLKSAIVVFFSLFVVITGCSHSGNPITGEIKQSDTQTSLVNRDQVSNATVLTSQSDRISTWQGVLGAYRVIINTETLEGEILPSRNSDAIGDVFDADLTQFLRVNPCHNCLQLGLMDIDGDNNVLVQFKIRHPFRDVNARPDLHAFDVRGIALTSGNKEFPDTQVTLPDNTIVPAKCNPNLLLNADGYTSHFDSLAENEFYFITPKNYEGNINPFKRFAVDTSGGTFDPLIPKGYNVFKVGSNWLDAIYKFKKPASGYIDFALVIEMAYGQSAVLANRKSPDYYLPWFNRKEPWKVDVNILSNSLVGGSPQSSATIRVNVCDWQAGLLADPAFPDSPLHTIPVKSDVKRITIEIPQVTNSIQIKTIPDTGGGTASDPYRFDFTVKNNLGAPGGNYFGIVAARDDINGTPGPFGVPEGPSGFPVEGEDFLDYSTYQVFEIEIAGLANNDPIIDTPPSSSLNPVNEGSLAEFSVTAHDPDSDQLEYLWQQVSPSSPQIIFQDSSLPVTFVFLPQVSHNTVFTISIIISDGRGGEVSDNFDLTILQVNRPPQITMGPFFFPLVITENETIDIEMNTIDPDGDPLTYNWVQIEPQTPLGEFTNPSLREPSWTAPAIANDTIFRLRVIISDDHLAVSATLDVPVGAINESPAGNILFSRNPPTVVPSQDIIAYTNFTDPDGNQIVLYEWDLNYDGSDFVPSGTTGQPVTLNFPDVGERTIACRATDNGDPQRSGIASAKLVVKGKLGSNVNASDITPPAVKIGSMSNQKAILRENDTLYLLFEAKTGTDKEFRLARSIDNGVSFDSSVLVTSEPLATPMEYPTLCVYGNYVWVAWSEDNDVEFARSTNSGASFDTEISLGTLADSPDHIPSMAIDPLSEELFVAYADNDGSGNGIINLKVSTDLGANFDPTGSYVTDDTASTSRADIAIAPDGRLYAAWIDQRNTVNGDVFFAMSTDGGDDFSSNSQVNLDYSMNGVDDLCLATGFNNEGYFAWRDYRSGAWDIYFATTVGSGGGVLENVNVTPILSLSASNPQLFINDPGKIYASFMAYTGSGYKTCFVIADYAGAFFTFVPYEANDITTATASSPLCDISGAIMPNGFADDLYLTWTDFRNGESSGFGDIMGQRYLFNSY